WLVGRESQPGLRGWVGVITVDTRCGFRWDVEVAEEVREKCQCELGLWCRHEDGVSRWLRKRGGETHGQGRSGGEMGCSREVGRRVLMRLQLGFMAKAGRQRELWLESGGRG
ncbi:unnamed protein product, partial [Sphenostylis stenocarpa]